MWLLEGSKKPRRLSSFNADVLAELELRKPVERHVTVDGRDIQGWFIPAGKGRQPLVTEIHGGPHTLYGWSPVWEFQVLAANGIGVFYATRAAPRATARPSTTRTTATGAPGRRATSWPASTRSSRTASPIPTASA